MSSFVDDFERRYLFTGTLTLKTGLHVGSAWTAGSPSDDPVVRTPDGRPFIPGSSFKGAFRSTVEKLAPAVDLTTCLLDHSDPDVACLSPQRSRLGEAFRLVRDRAGEQIDSDDRDTVSALETMGHPEWVGRRIVEKDLVTLLDEHLCHTCKLFGSPYSASRVTVNDLLPPEEDEHADAMIRVRDGVAIDRDSERAVEGLKYDYEVVAAAQTFEMRVLLQDPTDVDLALVCLGLTEFVSGLGYIGGNRSRGLGNCSIVDLSVYELDLTVESLADRGRRLKDYLLGRTLEEKMTRLPDPQAFLETQLMNLPALKEVPDA
jgi:CRISPR/Cas system CSM-associated protein Csm3 (group 7 of RAMP superfamily)